MMFQASDGKGRQFLNLVDDNLNIIKPMYTKGEPWLQVFGHSNSLCAHATRAITNHAPIGEYCLRFFSTRILNTLAEIILFSQEDTFFMSVQDLMGTGTQEEIY